MSDAHEALGRRLFGSVRQERPSAALRERVLALGRAERAQMQSGLARHPRGPERHVGFWSAKRSAVASLGLAACALTAAALAIHGALDASERVVMSPEQPETLATRGMIGASPPSQPAMSPPAEPPARPARPVAGSDPKRAKESARQLPQVKADAGPALAEPRSKLGEQLEQIKNARAALRAGDPARALELLDAYRARSASGELSAEASLLTIEALAVSGRRSDAARLARKFAVDHPNSPLIDRAMAFTNE